MNLRLQLSPDAALVEAPVEAVAGWRLLVGERALVLLPVAELLHEDLRLGPEVPPFDEMEIVPISTAPLTTYECTYLAALARHDEHYSEILNSIRFRAGIKAGSTVRWFYLSDCHYAPLTTEEISPLSVLRGYQKQPKNINFHRMGAKAKAKWRGQEAELAAIARYARRFLNRDFKTTGIQRGKLDFAIEKMKVEWVRKHKGTALEGFLRDKNNGWLRRIIHKDDWRKER